MRRCVLGKDKAYFSLELSGVHVPVTKDLQNTQICLVLEWFDKCSVLGLYTSKNECIDLVFRVISDIETSERKYTVFIEFLES